PKASARYASPALIINFCCGFVHFPASSRLYCALLIRAVRRENSFDTLSPSSWLRISLTQALISTSCSLKKRTAQSGILIAELFPFQLSKSDIKNDNAENKSCDTTCIDALLL